MKSLGTLLQDDGLQHDGTLDDGTLDERRSARQHGSRAAGRARLAAASLMVASVLGLLPFGTPSNSMFGAAIAHAQNFGQRTIHGRVLDDTETATAGATVFLKNLKTRNVKSFTSTPDGNFRFAQVGMIDEYEVWAERGKTKSAVKTISSFDSRKDVQFDLKLK